MRVVVTGAAGFLGSELVGALAGQGDQVLALYHRAPGTAVGAGVRWQPVDVTDLGAVRRALAGAAADAVVHTAYAQGAEGPAVNVAGTANVATACAEAGVRLMHVSSDVVFGGDRAPYDEDDPIDPLPGFVYGNEKADAERVVRERCPAATIVRTSLLWDGQGRASAEQLVIAGCEPDSPVAHFTDEFRCPVHVADVAAGILAILDRRGSGWGPPVVHLVGPERVSRFELARALAPLLGLEPGGVHAARGAEYPGPRPADLTLGIAVARAEFGWEPRPLPPA